MWECHIYKFHICDSEFVGLILKSEILDSYLAWSEVKLLSRVRLFATPWTVAYQALPSMGFSRQECWSGLPFPSQGDLPDPGIEPRSPALQADALLSEPPGKPTQYVRITFICLFWNSCSNFLRSSFFLIEGQLLDNVVLVSIKQFAELFKLNWAPFHCWAQEIFQK